MKAKKMEIRHEQQKDLLVGCREVLEFAITEPGAACMAHNTPKYYKRRLDAITEKARELLARMDAQK